MLRKLYLVYVSLCLIPILFGSYAKAQVDTAWIKNLGGWENCVAVDDNGYVYAANSWDNYITTYKFDPDGTELWKNTYRPASRIAAQAVDLELDPNGYVYVGGEASEFLGTLPDPPDMLYSKDLVVIKYDTSGVFQWASVYTGQSYKGFPGAGLLWAQDLELDQFGNSFLFGGQITGYPDDWTDNIVTVSFGADGNQNWVELSGPGPVSKGMYFREGVNSVSKWYRYDLGLTSMNLNSVVGAGATAIDTIPCIFSNYPFPDTIWYNLPRLTFMSFQVGGPQAHVYYDGGYTWDYCTDDQFWIYAYDIGSDGMGNVYITGIASAGYPTFLREIFLAKLNSSFGPVWRTAWPAPSGGVNGISVNSQGEILIPGAVSRRLNQSGGLVGTAGLFSSGHIDEEGFSYLGYYQVLAGFDQNFNEQWRMAVPENVIEIKTDKNGAVIVGGGGFVARFILSTILTMRDFSNDSIPDAKFDLIKIHNDPPFYTEDTLGAFVTDERGQLELNFVSSNTLLFPASPDNPTEDLILVGDTIKIARHLHELPAYKHPVILGSLYNNFIDNARFDSLGVMDYDTLTFGEQDIILNHTEYRFNLLVSIEWDASEDYLYELMANFRKLSNYFYDVSDGQIRLDTVLIYDNEEHWLEADIRIYASNTEWPRAHLSGMYNNNPGRIVTMPRKWFGSREKSIDSTYYEHPLILDYDGDFRTKCHELGHYSLAFYDEYLFYAGLNSSGDSTWDQSNRCGSNANYGFMDYQYPTTGERDKYSSEMSSSFQYEENDCKNTKQYLKRQEKSCWDYFESWAEQKFKLETDSLLAPITKPNDAERILQEGVNYIPGPNNDLDNLDYDVGALVQFPNSPSAPGIGVMEYDAEIQVAGVPVSRAEVSLLKPIAGNNWHEIKQGKTSDFGHIYVLGAEVNDKIKSMFGAVTITPTPNKLYSSHEIWYYGEMVIEDFVSGGVIPVQAVQGDYPLICNIDINDGSGSYILEALNPFSENPTIDLRPDSGGEFNYGFTLITDGYSAAINDNPGYAGTFTINAIDDSANYFFFNTEYTHADYDTGGVIRELLGPQGGSEILFDYDNTGLIEAILLSSPYPIIRTGLDATAIQAGEAHALAVYPDDAFNGSGVLRIRYLDSDITSAGGNPEDEAGLEIYEWNGVPTGWAKVGGSADTVNNEVVATIDSAGVYGAFTVSGPVDVGEEQGSTLLYNSELSQNYPNPFNPVTTINYSLPKKSKVTIEIFNILGQKIITLVDESKPAGDSQITWDGEDSSGKKVSAGIYLYRFQAGDYVETKKMILLK